MSNEEWEALRELVDDWSIAIKQADKGFCVVFVVEMNISKKLHVRLNLRRQLLLLSLLLLILLTDRLLNMAGC